MMSYGYLVSSLGGENGTATKELRAAIGEQLFADYMNRLNPDTHSDVFKGTSRCYACTAGKKTKDRMTGNLNTELNLNLLFFFTKCRVSSLECGMSRSVGVRQGMSRYDA